MTTIEAWSRARRTLAAGPARVALIFALAACGHPAKPDTSASAGDETATARPPEPRFYAFTIGELAAFAVQDGAMTYPNDGSRFAVGHAAEAADLLPVNGMATDTLALSIQCLAVNLGDHVIMFDTGTGAGRPGTGGLLASMDAAGVDPGSVTEVFISHLHDDHTGGLVGRDGGLAFPRAKVHMSAPEWVAMQADPDLASIVETVKGVVVTFEPGAQLLPEVRAVDTRGHTPGHSSYEITSASDHLFYLGDVAHHSILSVQRPEWPAKSDDDKPASRAMREKTLGDLAAANERVFAVHFPFPGLGHVVETDTGWSWQAE